MRNRTGRFAIVCSGVLLTLAATVAGCADTEIPSSAAADEASEDPYASIGGLEAASSATKGFAPDGLDLEGMGREVSLKEARQVMGGTLLLPQESAVGAPVLVEVYDSPEQTKAGLQEMAVLYPKAIKLWISPGMTNENDYVARALADREVPLEYEGGRDPKSVRKVGDVQAVIQDRAVQILGGGRKNPIPAAAGFVYGDREYLLRSFEVDSSDLVKIAENMLAQR